MHLKPWKTAALASAVISVCACGGGGSSAPANQSVSGIWTDQYTAGSGINSGDAINAIALVAENGEYFSLAENTITGCADLTFGTLSTTGSTVSGTSDWAEVEYTTIAGSSATCVETDGSISGTGTITGTVAQQASLSLTETDTTSAGTVLPAYATTATFSDAYSTPSALTSIAGNYNDGGNTFTISSDGTIFEQDTNGCVINGTVSIIDASYNVYGMQLTFSGCTSNANLNGVSLSGLVTLDSTSSPVAIVGGVNGTADGFFVATAFQLAAT